MKSPLLAFTLSFFLPGAGLWYLGKLAWGLVNLAVVLVIGVIAAVVLDEEVIERYIRYLAIGCAGGSGGLAMALAQQMNQRRNNGGSSPTGERRNAQPGAGSQGPLD
jgi:TM2 domain-containing membrane protein YozV